MFDSKLVQSLIHLALEEDQVWTDVTSKTCVAVTAQASATIIARQQLVVCGLPILQQIIKIYKSKIKIKLLARDGQLRNDMDALALLSGPARDLLALERTFLNFLQRLSGVATFTRAVNEAKPQGLVLLDTRKTTPGWRLLEKYAVTVGGAKNHRFNLADMILVKNNHIDANGGDLRATLSKFTRIRRTSKIKLEVEVRNIEELKTALEFKPDIIMLDNFSDTEIKAAISEVRRSKTDSIIEASGGVSKKRLSKLNRLGVDCASMGALTTQVKNVDISMRLKILS